MRPKHTKHFTGICRWQPEPGLDHTMGTGSRTVGKGVGEGEEGAMGCGFSSR